MRVCRYFDVELRAQQDPALDRRAVEQALQKLLKDPVSFEKSLVLGGCSHVAITVMHCLRSLAKSSCRAELKGVYDVLFDTHELGSVEKELAANWIEHHVVLAARRKRPIPANSLILYEAVGETRVLRLFSPRLNSSGMPLAPNSPLASPVNFAMIDDDLVSSAVQ